MINTQRAFGNTIHQNNGFQRAVEWGPGGAQILETYNCGEFIGNRYLAYTNHICYILFRKQGAEVIQYRLAVGANCLAGYTRAQIGEVGSFVLNLYGMAGGSWFGVGILFLFLIAAA